MYKYEVIDREPTMDELKDLKTLLNMNLKIFIGSDFAEVLETEFNELDDTLAEAEQFFKDEIETLKDRIAELEKEVEELNDRL